MSHSFCQHAVGGAEPLVIEDAREHPLVRESRAISDLNAVAYAGIPLLSSDGYALGSFCVLDDKPRSWTREEIETLSDLARSATTEIELRMEVETRRQVEEERLRLMEELRVERTRLLSVFMEAPAGIALCSGPDHRIEMANPHFLRLTGFRELVGKTVREAFPELEGQPCFDLLDGVYRSGRAYVANEFPARVDRTGDGALTEGFFNFVYQPLFDGRGVETVGILVHAVEVTEQVEARRQVKRLAAERDATLQQIAGGVIVTDPAGRITFVNEAARRIHGTQRMGVGVSDYAETYRLFTLDGEPYPPEQLPLARAVLRGETVVHAEWIIRREDGSEVIAQGSATPVRGEGGEALGAVLSLRDVTEQRRLERQRAELLGGSLEARSTPGRGSTFRLLLPNQAGEGAE